jgi:hypothetical protein
MGLERRSVECCRGIPGWLSWLSISAAACLSGSELKRDETVLFFSGLGSQEPTGWQLDIHGWVYESEYHKPITSLLRRSLGIRDDELTPAEQALFRKRAQFFLVDNERRKTVDIRLGDMALTVAASLPNGHFQTSLHIRSDDIQRFGLTTLLSQHALPFETVPSRKGVIRRTGEIQLIPETGVSVISDIDDTIKLTNVTNRHELLRNTFCRSYEAIPGMASVFQQWSQTNDARFHYLSASPWQLGQPLTAFLRENAFPTGSMHLKTFRWKDETFFELFRSPERYKLSMIEPILRRFPKRQFVLVGDSGEKDPEIYGALARIHTNQVTQIFIRNTTGEDRRAERYRWVFEGLATNRWQVFSSPSELPISLR